MGILSRSNLHHSRRTTTIFMATIAAIGFSVPNVTLAHSTTQGAHSVISAGPCSGPDMPSLWTYEFDHHLKLSGACYTLHGRVYVKVKLNSGTVYFSRWMTAREHPYHTEGWFNVDTNLYSPCNQPVNNGYARVRSGDG